MKKLNSDSISIMRGVAIILVIYGHVIQGSLISINKDFFLNEIFKIIYSFHMPLFIFISGYLVTFSLERKQEIEVIKSRISSLVIPLISWTILGSIVSYTIKSIKARQILSINSFFIDTIRTLVVYPSIWFLYVLFLLTLILLLSRKLEKRYGLSAYIIIYFLLLVLPYSQYFGVYYIKWFYMFYLLGYLSNRFTLNLFNKRFKYISIIAFLILIQYWSKDDYIYINKMQFLSNNYISEVIDFVYRWAERVVVFSDGKIIADGTPVEIFKDQEVLEKANLKKPTMLEMYELLLEKGLLKNKDLYPKTVQELKKNF